MKTKIFAVSAAMTVLFTACGDVSEERPEINVITQTSATSEDTAVSFSETETPEYTEYDPDNDNMVYSVECNSSIKHFSISADNPYIISPIEYAVDNDAGTVSLNVTYENYADIYTLRHCIIDVELSEGTYFFDEAALNEDGTVNLEKPLKMVVTDGSGNTKRYVVTTERTVYDLPIVNIYLENMNDVSTIDRDEHMPMTFFVDCAGTDEFGDTDVIGGKIRGRGHSTWDWKKKPYKIKLEKDISVLGLAANNDWILLANYSDKSLMRDTVAYDMARTLDGLDWSPTQIPVDLFINGIYRGVYSFGEHMELGNGRVNVQTDTSAADTGVLLEIGGADDESMKNGVDYFHTKSKAVTFITFKDPPADKLTEEQRSFIIDYVGKADDAIISGEGYDEYIDVKSFCDWIIIHELTYNLDSCFRRSCYITKDKGGKLKMGPVWDFDIAFGNCNKDTQTYDDWVTVGSNSESAYIKTNWCNYLMEDEEFRSVLRDRWFEVRDDLLTAAMKSIDVNSEKIYRSQQENFKVWDNMNTRVGFQSWKNLEATTYEMQTEYLRNFLEKRAKWIDENI